VDGITCRFQGNGLRRYGKENLMLEPAVGGLLEKVQALKVVLEWLKGDIR